MIEQFRQSAKTPFAGHASTTTVASSSAVKTSMTRRYGRAPRGERVNERAPRNYGAHTSVIGALSLRGLFATMTVEGAVGALCFDA
jgi:hypothetical protein